MFLPILFTFFSFYVSIIGIGVLLMNYDKILEQVLFANSKEEIDEILRCTINKMREACAEISDEEKTEFVLKLMNLRKKWD